MNALQRFYKNVVPAPGLSEELGEGGFCLLLDGKPLRSPQGQVISLPSPGIAESLAQEWRLQAEKVNFLTMPLTRLIYRIQDKKSEKDKKVEALMAYASSDLLCYLAEEPELLRQRQMEAWDPIIRSLEQGLGCQIARTSGLMFVSQSEKTLNRLKAFIEHYFSTYPMPLLWESCHQMTQLTGSLFLTLAFCLKIISEEDMWHCVHIDQDYQMEVWGMCEEVVQARLQPWQDLCAAAYIITDLTI